MPPAAGWGATTTGWGSTVTKSATRAQGAGLRDPAVWIQLSAARPPCCRKPPLTWSETDTHTKKYTWSINKIKLSNKQTLRKKISVIYCMLNNNSLLPGSCKCQFVRRQSTETLSPEFPDSGTLPINQTVTLVMTISIHVSHWCNDFKLRMCDWGIWLQICNHTSSKTDAPGLTDFLL